MAVFPKVSEILKITCLAVGVLAFIPASASAAPILFTHAGGNATGTLDGVAFSTTQFVITAQGDTNNRESIPFTGFAIDHDTASISIATLGTFEILSPTRTFVNNEDSVTGFSRTGASRSDLFNGPENAVFSGWDMLSSIGLVSGQGELLQWGPPRSLIETTGGILIFDDAFTSVEFSAQVVPLPAAAWLFLGALGSLGIARWLRSKPA